MSDVLLKECTVINLKKKLLRSCYTNLTVFWIFIFEFLRELLLQIVLKFDKCNLRVVPYNGRIYRYKFENTNLNAALKVLPFFEHFGIFERIASTNFFKVVNLSNVIFEWFVRQDIPLVIWYTAVIQIGQRQSQIFTVILRFKVSVSFLLPTHNLIIFFWWAINQKNLIKLKFYLIYVLW